MKPQPPPAVPSPEQKGGVRAGGRRRLSLVSSSDVAREPTTAQPSSHPEPPLAEVGAPGPISTRAPARAALAALTDAQLVGLARQKDQKAFEILYRRHVAFAIHLATRIEGSTRDVDDVVHDAFIKAFTRIGDLSDPAAFRSWLGSIVVFAVRTRLRRTRLMTILGLGRGADPIDLDSLASPAASPHTRAQLAQIYALLRTLPTDERIAWTLRAVEGHELEACAKLTGCSLATVKRRISRAQRFLDDTFVNEDRENDEPKAPSRDSQGHL